MSGASSGVAVAAEMTVGGFSGAGLIAGRGSGSGTGFTAAAWVDEQAPAGTDPPGLRRFMVLGRILQRIGLREQLCNLLRRPRVRHRHLRPRATGSRLFGTSITKLPNCLMRPATLPAPRRRRNRCRRAPARRWRSRCPARSSGGGTASRASPLDRQFGVDQERRAVDMQRFVDRERAARRQRHALRADRLVLVAPAAFRGRRRRTCSAAAARRPSSGLPPSSRGSCPSTCLPSG